VLGGDEAGVRLAALLQATLPGAPFVYYGDEVGLLGGNDPGSRGAFPWDPSRWEPGLRESVRALLRLRSSESGLRDSPLLVAGAAGNAVAFERGAGSSRFVVAANVGQEPVDLILRFDRETSGRDLVPVPVPGFECQPTYASAAPTASEPSKASHHAMSSAWRFQSTYSATPPPRFSRTRPATPIHVSSSSAPISLISIMAPMLRRLLASEGSRNTSVDQGLAPRSEARAARPELRGG
jgi:hypothetical protein